MAHPVLVVVDVQERLFNAMDAERRDDMVANVKILVSAAHRLDVPVVVTEQYPKGLGRTLPELKALFGETPPFEKTTFSCAVTKSSVPRCAIVSRFNDLAWSKSNSSRLLRAGKRAARMRPSPP